MSVFYSSTLVEESSLCLKKHQLRLTMNSSIFEDSRAMTISARTGQLDPGGTHAVTEGQLKLA